MLGERAMHHIALKVVDLEACTIFYRDVLGLPWMRHHDDAQGVMRSVWLRLGHGGILMLERTAATPPAPPTPAASTANPPRGWHLLALTITLAERAHFERTLPEKGVTITGRTDYTLYIADPEGNRLGLSHYPTLKPA